MKFCVVLLSTPRKIRDGTFTYTTARPIHILHNSLNSNYPILRRKSMKIQHGAVSRSTIKWGRDSSVGTVTRYGLDGPGIESRWGARFSAPVQTHPASCTMGTGSFSGVKRPGRVADTPPHLQCRGLKLGRAIYLYPPQGP